MLERLPALVGLSFISVCAPAAQPRLFLQDLLSIGLPPPAATLKWGATRRQIERRYPELGEHPAFLGFRLQARLSEQGCTFIAYLSGNRRSDRLEQIWIEYRAGDLPECRQHLEALLARLYGPPSTIDTPATRDSGRVTQSDWQSATTCVILRWEEQGAEHGVSPLNVKLGDLSAACPEADRGLRAGTRNP